VAAEAIIPGQIQGTIVETINHPAAAGPYFLTHPANTDSPVTKLYLSISIFKKNCNVIPTTATQAMFNPKLLTRYGHKINSPVPSPTPKIIKLGPISFDNLHAGGISLIHKSYHRLASLQMFP